MSVITVSLSKALLCIASECFPALVGQTTPTGVYSLERVYTDSPGYGGDVLEFAEAEDGSVFAVHRVWLLNPKQHRLERLRSLDPKKRRHITGGCINVDPAVYDELQDATEIVITP